MNLSERKPPVRVTTFKRRRIVETDLEQWARQEIRIAGGLMVKTTSPGTRGFPDNIIFWFRPQARRGFRNVVHLAEFKILDREPDEQQKEMHALLIAHGAAIFIPRNRQQVQEYIDRWRP